MGSKLAAQAMDGKLMDKSKKVKPAASFRVPRARRKRLIESLFLATLAASSGP
jgi:hypothetical protein